MLSMTNNCYAACRYGHSFDAMPGATIKKVTNDSRSSSLSSYTVHRDKKSANGRKYTQWQDVGQCVLLYMHKLWCLPTYLEYTQEYFTNSTRNRLCKYQGMVSELMDSFPGILPGYIGHRNRDTGGRPTSSLIHYISFPHYGIESPMTQSRLTTGFIPTLATSVSFPLFLGYKNEIMCTCTPETISEDPPSWCVLTYITQKEE